MRRVLIFLGLLGAFGACVGLFGGLHRVADALSLLRPVFGGLMIVGAYATRHRALRVWLGLGGVLAVASALIFLRDQPPGGDLRIYSKNVLFSNRAAEAVVREIQSAGVEVVMLQEISPQNKRVLALLENEFPHQHLCKNGPFYGIALLSKHSFIEAPLCTRNRALAAARIEKQGQPVWVVSVHIPWHWPMGVPASEAEAEAVLGALEEPVVLAGDFNSFPWSGRIQRARALTQTRVAGPTRRSFYLDAVRLPLPLDHVLAPGGGQVRYGRRLGADHLGLVADISLGP